MKSNTVKYVLLLFLFPLSWGRQPVCISEGGAGHMDMRLFSGETRALNQ